MRGEVVSRYSGFKTSPNWSKGPDPEPAGKITKKWDRTGQVVEDLGYNKYRFRVDGRGRVSDQNRQITPVTPSLPGPLPGPSCHDTAQCPVTAPAQPRLNLCVIYIYRD